MPTLGDQLLQEMRDWLVDCYPDDEEYIEEAAPILILKYIQIAYGGGLFAFVEEIVTRAPPISK